MKNMEGEKAPRCYLKKNRRLCAQLFEISHLLISYCLLSSAKTAIRSRLHTWQILLALLMLLLQGGGCSIPFLVWYHTCQNTAKRNLTILCYSFHLHAQNSVLFHYSIFLQNPVEVCWFVNTQKHMLVQ